MDSKSRIRAALFGIEASGAVWVADHAIVTRRNGDILVEGWVGNRVASVLVRQHSTGTTRAIWEQLNEVAVDDEPTPLPTVPDRSSTPELRRRRHFL